jgi:ABC-type polysaccharide/polyol phosphate transport system ATPase subunit
MSENAILVENLSKRYLIGHRSSSSEGRYKYMAMRDVIARELHNFARKAADVVRWRQVVQGDEVEDFWALQGVSFDVKQGEVLGIVGRNGAGKSTLLKILSRITEPTEGRITLRGRVASLLEVGTGFHPELTGRENIFLNGAVLGMTQREIRKKFDEIVAFAEVEKFLDTPVKHYSSGMYVRLAFAVAANLESEVLIRAITSSASAFSVNPVKPRRSQKSAVISCRWLSSCRLVPALNCRHEGAMAPAPKIPTLKFCWCGLCLPRPWSTRKATLPLHMAFRAADPKGELRSAYGRWAPIASTEPPKLVAIPSWLRLHHRRSYVADARN